MNQGPNKLHLVDGTFELFRCFHGAPRATQGGREVGATRGLLHTFAALLRQDDVTHVAIAFDQVLDLSTPAGRASGQDALASQHGLAAEATRALGLAIWPMARRYEADDALATGAARFKDAVEQVVLCTTDKDLAQCVEGQRVVLLDRIRKVVRDEDGVREKFGVTPQAIPEYLALVGDKADGIPGVPGWGKTSAAAVLARYPTVEEIPASGADWDVQVRGRDRLARALQERRLETILCRNLAVLATDVPIPHTLDDLEWRGADRAALTALAERIGAEDVLDGIPKWKDED